MSEVEFQAFPKIPRLNREIIITEKIDGTNAAVVVTEPPYGVGAGEVFEGGIVTNDRKAFVYAQSRKRIITPEDDNFGFARWVRENAESLQELGEGRHFGEWWGSGIQRGYGLPKGEKRFSLFNTYRWTEENTPKCVSVVPVIGTNPVLDAGAVRAALRWLEIHGSQAAPGFMNPEGLIVFQPQSRLLFKATIKDDEVPKSLVA